MIGWLYRWLIGRFHMCEHNWETMKHIDVVNDYNVTVYSRIQLRCTKCGEWTYRDLGT